MTEKITQDKINPETQKLLDKERGKMKELTEKDNPYYENSAKDIAEEENIFRQEMSSLGVEKETINILADRYATQVMEKIEAKKLALIDGLTELPNKRYLKENLPHLLSFLKREGKQGALLMLDIDHFKQTNDTYGHPVGDIVLKKIANIIKENVREADLMFRYGGEEFTIFLMDTDTAGALKVAEKIKEAVEKATLLEIQTDETKNTAIKKTVSIGYVDTLNTPEWSSTGSSKPEMKATLEKMISI